MSSSNRFEIGPWGIVKNEIVEKYCKAYLGVFKYQNWAETCYVDVFAGAPYNSLRGTGSQVSGSAVRALDLEPSFNEYCFIDVDEVKALALENECARRPNARVIHGDGNQYLRDRMIPRLKANPKLRTLILIDPYGMEIAWDTIVALGQIGHSDVIINFPTMDINRNALRRKIEAHHPTQAARMTNLWGDDSWQDAFYAPSAQMSLFGEPVPTEKTATNQIVVGAYCDRLRDHAGFRFVSDPIGIKNSRNSVLYYLILASPKAVGKRIMKDIQKRYS